MTQDSSLWWLGSSNQNHNHATKSIQSTLLPHRHHQLLVSSGKVMLKRLVPKCAQRVSSMKSSASIVACFWAYPTFNILANLERNLCITWMMIHAVWELIMKS
eukprot:1760620-Ditylum_brightwellii.AAC.1